MVRADYEWVLLGGERRYVAALAEGADFVRVVQVSDWAGLLDWMNEDRNRGGVTPLKMLWTEAGRFVNKVVTYVRPPHHGSPQAWGPALAEYVGRHAGNLGYLRRLLAASDHEDASVRQLVRRRLAEVDEERIAPGTGWEHVRTLMASQEAPPGLGLAAQLRALNNMGPQVAGLAAALESLGRLDPNHKPENCKRWKDQLSQLRRQLERTIKELGREI